MELEGALTIFLALCLSYLLIFTAWKQINKRKKLPPCPTPLPFLGNLLHVCTGDNFQSLMKVSLVSPFRHG
uniref:Cytochrome P450 n=1 Tax=Equus asinus TaxID=9793 RepID=A0A8C4LDJ3_EQUAS